jgi:hexokinase
MLDFSHILIKNSELKQIYKSFRDELEKTSDGHQTSFAYIHSPIPQKKLVEKGEVFQVIMFGGSHIETAMMVANEEKSFIVDFDKTSIPLLINKQVFFETFERHLRPAVRYVALNFAFPIQTITRKGILDGVLIGAPKGHTFDGMLSKTVGLELEKYIFKKQNRLITVSVCNDSTAMGLATINLKTGFDWKNTAVGIVGTGTNFGFFENNKTFVNLESGNFNKFEQSRTGQIIDAISDNHLEHWIEKEVSGAYLFQHFNILASEYSLPFHLASTQQLDQLAQGLQPEDLDTIKSNDPGKQFFINHNDIPENYMELLNDAVNLARTLLKKSASLIACKVAGLRDYLQTRHPKHTQKVLFMMEGSMFWSSLDYYHNVRLTLKDLGVDPETIVFEHQSHAGLFGASKLINPIHMQMI